MADPTDIDALASEVATGNFKDERLNARLERLVRGLARAPEESLPCALSSSELEGAYRFFSNTVVTPEQILGPHVEAVAARVAAESSVRVLHDTTEFAYRRDGKRRGFDEERSYQSFCGHFSIAVDAGVTRRPLGLAALKTWPKGRSTQSEQSCWLTQIVAAEQSLGCGRKAIHVCDRGADDYVLLHELVERGHRFVLRSSIDRWTMPCDGATAKLRSVIAKVEHVEERSVWINRRRRESSEHRAKCHPAREPRAITLHLSAATVNLVRPTTAKIKKQQPLASLPPTLTVHVVRAWEPSPPEGAAPVEWYLFTTEPIATSSDVEAIVDHYRARWVIEEYFKALKTGCAFEKRQLQDYESLVNALAVFIPIAYRLLLLRTVARATPDAPASTVISADELDVLRALGRRKLPDTPTARDVLLGVAALGGHQPSAPDPGWLTLARGFEQLETMTRGWVAAKIQPHSDQR